MTATPPKPNLSKSTALAKTQTTEGRLNDFLPTIASNNSPITVYLPAGPTGNELTANASSTPGGTWTCPAGITSVQVECFGAGGGGGGGSSSSGGGAGGGGEYACEPEYPVIPGQSYAYALGASGIGAVNGPGGAGGTTTFDAQGLGITGGVVANGGQGGDTLGTGQGGDGGTGSKNSVQFDGGAGGTNNSGIASDNPSTLANLHAWWKLDDFTGKLGANGNWAGTDFSGSRHTGSSTSIHGQVFVTTGAPPQAPTVTNSGTKEIAGGCVKFNYTNNLQIGYLTSLSSIGFSGNALSLSCWITGDGSGSWGGYWSTLAANCDYPGNKQGYALYIQNGFINAYVQPSDNSSNSRTVRWQIPSPSWANSWHQVGFTLGGNTITLYVDGAAVASASNTGGLAAGGGAYNTTIGCNPNSQWNNYQGYMSNIWLAVSTVSPAYFAQAFGTTPATGGAGGGASGGSAGAGTSGSGGSGAVGGSGGVSAGPSQPTINTGSAAGAAGGNTGISGSTPAAVAPYASGGGGAGSHSSTAPVTASFTTTLSQSYCGPDAASGNAGQPIPPSGSVPTVTQGGTPNGNGAYQGTVNSLMVLPAGIAQQLAGASIQQVTLTFQPWSGAGNAGSANLLLGYANFSTLPGTWAGTGITQIANTTVSTDSSEEITLDLTATGLGSALMSGSATALTIGPGTAPGAAAYDGPNANMYDLSLVGAGGVYAGQITDPTLTVSYTNGAAVSGGNGGPGYIAVTYVNPEGSPVASMQPQAVTDDTGNQHAAAYTGQISAYDPTVTAPGNYKPESWKILAAPSGITGTLRYKLLSEINMVFIDVNCVIQSASSSSGTAFTYAAALQPQYWPSVVSSNGNLREFPLSTNGAWASVSNGSPRLQVTSTGAVTIAAPQYTTATGGNAVRITGTIMYPTD